MRRQQFCEVMICTLAGLTLPRALLSADIPTLAAESSISLPDRLPDLSAEVTRLRDRGYIVIAVKDNRPPLGFRDANGRLAGLEIEIAERIGQAVMAGVGEVRLQGVANRDRLPQLLAQQIDLVIAGLTATETRARLVLFSSPYYLDGARLVTSVPQVRQVDDLQQQTIAVLEGSTTIAALRSRLPTARLRGVSSYSTAYRLLERGEAIAFAGDTSILVDWVQQQPHYRLLSERLSTAPLCVALRRGLQSETLRQLVEQVLAQLRREGWLQQRLLAWNLP